MVKILIISILTVFLVASFLDDNVTQYFYDSDNNALGFSFENTLYLYVKDKLGVIRAIVDSNLNPIVSYEYDDWGVPYITNTSSTKIVKNNQIIYKDYVYDYDTDLYYLGSRYYNPQIRRFISQDSLEKISEQGLNDFNFNLYSYCNNNPIMLSDGNGYEAITISIGAILFVLGCVLVICLASYIIVDTIIKEVSKAYRPSIPNIDSVTSNSREKLYTIVEIIKKAVTLTIAETAVTIWMWWKKDNKKDEHHHIIAKSAPKAYIARNLYLYKYKRDINAVENMIWLKYRLHKHLHTDIYYNAVNSYMVLGDRFNSLSIFLLHLQNIKTALGLLNDSIPL